MSALTVQVRVKPFSLKSMFVQKKGVIESLNVMLTDTELIELNRTTIVIVYNRKSNIKLSKNANLLKRWIIGEPEVIEICHLKFHTYLTSYLLPLTMLKEIWSVSSYIPTIFQTLSQLLLINCKKWNSHHLSWLCKENHSFVCFVSIKWRCVFNP